MQPTALDDPSASAREESAPPDGRRARWTEHRRARREDLVTAAVEAVRLAGPEFAVEDVARSAGVSKTVIYRYFSDKDELVDAVLGRISEAILLPRLLGELAADRGDDRARLHAVIAAFVSLIEDEPALYRFAYAHAGRSGRADLVAATEREIAEALGVLMGERLTAAGRPADPALTWAYGVVGMVQLAAHWWSATRTVPSAQLVDQLTDLAHGGLGTLLPPTR
ncbi:TetR/AcrR family transcriptional regulator [Blastococcus sp. TF02-09]|uniref:TetR/AcrR family transcriptional regulator n=1 Tax=Blastococcus sp. TF02-09 TaxID=2250576 RepID=UPI000DEAFF18|nr:TetR/AcrR family transcriptional regulator [Blastococcus sp. TF02-9]RBY74566.1 TetR/AcrR family transcriptional regulator [Blastococcus sp. TF02-9]